MKIVYEDKWLIVVDKPAGLLSMSTGKSAEVTARARSRHSNQQRHHTQPLQAVSREHPHDDIREEWST